jgi:hypothetical protein
MIDKVPMEDRDTKGDLYEYMLGKIASAGMAVDKMQRCTGNPSSHKLFRLPNARQSWRNRQKSNHPV